MALIDEIERLGRAVAEGTMSRADALAELVGASDGGLTSVGAASVLDEWATARDRYERSYREARKGQIEALDELYEL